MINFLVVDDIMNNVEILELLISGYMEDKDIDEDHYLIHTAGNGQEAVALAQEKDIDMIFLDVMMPVMNGFGALTTIREMHLPKQPIIIMATALGDADTIQREKKEGANAYMVKPFSKKTIAIMLDHYLNKIMDNTTSEDDFFEFDDFDSDLTIHNQKELMEKFNESHKELSTKDFLEEYDYILDDVFLDLEEIDCILMNHFNLEDDELDLALNKAEIEEFFALFFKLLHKFSEFDELASSISALEELYADLDISQLSDDEKELVGLYIKAIIMDLNDWKEHVFVLQDANNVFYANASLFSSYLEVKEILK